MGAKGGDDESKIDKRKVFWKIPVKQWDKEYIAKYLPIFAVGLREKQEPQMFLAVEGFREIVTTITPK